MKKHEGKACLMFFYHLVAPIVVKTFYRCCLLSITLVDPLQLLPIVYNTYRPFIVITYCLQHLQTLCSYCLAFITFVDPLQLMPIVCSNSLPSANLKSSGYLLAIAFQWQLPSCHKMHFLFQNQNIEQIILQLYRRK